MTNGASSVLTDNSYHALRILRISGDGDLYSQFMQPCYRCWFTSHKVLKLSQMLLMMSTLSIGWPSETALGNLSTLSLLQKPAWPARILTHVQNAEPHRQCSWWTFSITNHDMSNNHNDKMQHMSTTNYNMQMYLCCCIISAVGSRTDMIM